MKYFLPVQEREAKIPAPVLEAAAWAASAPPPLTPLSVVLHGKSDCEKRFNLIPFPDSFLAHFSVIPNVYLLPDMTSWN
jgi:hypothetical protein